MVQWVRFVQKQVIENFILIFMTKNIINHYDVRNSEKHNLHYLLSPAMCDYVSARYLLISDTNNRSAFSLVSQFLEKAIKQIIILFNESDVRKHFDESGGDIFSYLKAESLTHHNIKTLLENYSHIDLFKEMIDNPQYLDFVSSFSDLNKSEKYFSDTRYGKYYLGAQYPTLINLLDELAFKLINIEIAKLSNHPIKVHVPYNMKKLFLLRNKLFSIDTIEEMPIFPDEKLI